MEGRQSLSTRSFQVAVIPFALGFELLGEITRLHVDGGVYKPRGLIVFICLANCHLGPMKSRPSSCYTFGTSLWRCSHVQASRTFRRQIAADQAFVWETSTWYLTSRKVRVELFSAIVKRVASAMTVGRGLVFALRSRLGDVTGNRWRTREQKSVHKNFRRRTRSQIVQQMLQGIQGVISRLSSCNCLHCYSIDSRVTLLSTRLKKH